jgi:hypothetical protein
MREIGTSWDRDNRNIMNDNFRESKNRVDNLIKNTPQPSEVVDIRVDEEGVIHTTAKERIDTESLKRKVKDDELTAQLAQIAINPSSFKQPTDVDDTDSIKRAVTHAYNQGYRKIVLPYKSKYLVTKPTHFTGLNDVILDGNNSLIAYDGREVVDTLSEFDIGVLTFHGERNTEIQQSLLAWNPRVYLNTNIVPEANYTGSAFNCSKVTVADASMFNRGDYVYFEVNNPNGGQNADYRNVFIPTCGVTTKILAIVGNDIYIDYYSPYDWSQVDVKETGYIVKVNPIDNITVENMIFKDITPYAAEEGSTGINPNAAKLVTGIGLRYVVNYKLNNIKGLEMNRHLITAFYTYKGNVSKFENKFPRSHGGGEGYGIQVSRSLRVHVEDAESNDGNSVVDFSGSAFCSGKRIHSNHTYSYKTIGVHGQAEHDITFEDCVGSFGFNNGATIFAGMSINMKLVRCRGRINSGIDGFVEVDIINSEITLSENKVEYFARLDVSDSVIKVEPLAALGGHRRPVNIPSRISFNGNTKVVNTDSTPGVTYFKLIDFAQAVIDCNVDFTDSGGDFAFEDVKSIKVGGYLLNTEFSLIYRNQKTSRANMIISSTLIEQTVANKGYFIVLEEVSDVTLSVTIAGNTYDMDVAGTQTVLWAASRIGLNFEYKTNADILVNVVGNTLTALEPNALVLRNTKESNETVSTSINGHSVANITKNVVLGGTGSDIADIVPYTQTAFKPHSIGALSVNDATDRAYLAVGNNAPADWSEIVLRKNGTTSQRPTSAGVGTYYYDTTLKKPIWYDGVGWRDSSGTLV